jgi:uncharacterized tellurite resistance protein B-like protein
MMQMIPRGVHTMPILTLLNRVKSRLEQHPHPVMATEPSFKRDYLTGLAMQALCDGSLSASERRHFLEMAQTFDISEETALKILSLAGSADEHAVSAIRGSLIGSKYKYYFILDLQIMAHQDREVKDVESEVLKQFGEILEVDADDRAFLVELADAVAEEDPGAKEAWVRGFFHEGTIEEARPEDFAHYTK